MASGPTVKERSSQDQGVWKDFVSLHQLPEFTVQNPIVITIGAQFCLVGGE